MLIARLGRALVLVIAVAAPISATAAQDSARSVVDELLDGITGDVNDLRYDDAIRRARALAMQGNRLSVAARTRVHLLLAAAFFPVEVPQQRPDSARAHLAAAIRLTPDAAYTADLRWRGLDALLAEMRLLTVSAVLRAPDRVAIGGPQAPAVLPVVSSAPSRFDLEVRSVGNATVVHRLSTAGARAAFAFTLHDGSRLLVPPGEYDLVLIVRRDGTTDSAVTSQPIRIEAPALDLEPEPTFNEASLRPEIVAPDRRQMLTAGTVATVATLLLGTVARRDPDLRATYATDPRVFIGAGAIVTAVFSVWSRPTPRPVPAHVAANREARLAHDRAVSAARSRNAARLTAYTGTLSFETGRR